MKRKCNATSYFLYHHIFKYALLHIYLQELIKNPYALAVTTLLYHVFLLKNMIFILFYQPQQLEIGSTVFPKIYNRASNASAESSHRISHRGQMILV